MGRWDPATAANQAAGNNFGYGYLWVGGVSWNDLPVWAHELGHNVSRRRGGGGEGHTAGYLWVGDVSWNDLPVWAHELGHNVSWRRGGGASENLTAVTPHPPPLCSGSDGVALRKEGSLTQNDALLCPTCLTDHPGRASPSPFPHRWVSPTRGARSCHGECLQGRNA